MEKKRVFINSMLTVGKNAPTALNVLVGANDYSQMCKEHEKIYALLDSDFPISIITDLSTFSALKGESLWEIVARDGRCIAGTVPVYQTISDNHTIEKNRLLELIQLQAEGGVRLITIHPTPSLDLLESSKKRLVPITSRGGAAVCIDMLKNNRKENVYIQLLDEIIKIANRYSVVLSIGSSFRSANIYDALDSTYYMELNKQIEIADYCYQRNVKVIVETPGHVSPQGIFELCDFLNQKCQYPIMPLGPIPTDCAFEQDDLAASIGAVLMGTRGCADILSVVTRDEHLGGIPSKDSIIEAVKKYTVAKHIIDIYKTNDTSCDYNTALIRSKKRSCIMEGKDCSRCAAICPLKLEMND